MPLPPYTATPSPAHSKRPTTPPKSPPHLSTYLCVQNSQISTSLHQQLYHILVPIGGCVHQRGHALTGHAPRVINTCLVVQQEARYLKMAVVTRLVKWSPATVVPGVDLCTLVYQYPLHTTFYPLPNQSILIANQSILYPLPKSTFTKLPYNTNQSISNPIPKLPLPSNH